jgi:hypothetical protein
VPEFGDVISVDLREMWPHEATNFTPWLAENLNRLGAALGLDLELTSSESPVGSFSCDVEARDLSTEVGLDPVSRTGWGLILKR